MPSSTCLEIGKPAPNFTLKDQQGNAVSLDQFKNKKNVVLIFYPGDMTPGCTMQLCSIRDDWSKFNAKDTVVFGINHADAESHAAFIKKYAFPFPLLIDSNKKLSEHYGAIRMFFKNRIIRRTVIVIDKTGTIVYLKHGMPKTSDILKHLS
jgi:peroxiredoxin Q/BCP